MLAFSANKVYHRSQYTSHEQCRYEKDGVELAGDKRVAKETEAQCCDRLEIEQIGEILRLWFIRDKKKKTKMRTPLDTAVTLR